MLAHSGAQAVPTPRATQRSPAATGNAGAAAAKTRSRGLAHRPGAVGGSLRKAPKKKKTQEAFQVHGDLTCKYRLLDVPHPASREDRNKYIERYRDASPELEGPWEHVFVCPSCSQSRLSHSRNGERLWEQCLIGYGKAINYANSTRPPSPSRRAQRAPGVPLCSQGQASKPHPKASQHSQRPALPAATAPQQAQHCTLAQHPQHPESLAQHPLRPVSPARHPLC